MLPGSSAATARNSRSSRSNVLAHRALPASLVAAVAPASPAGAALGVGIGGVLGLLGGGGSALALPAFLYAFGEPPTSAIAESLVVVSLGAGVGLAARGGAQRVDAEVVAPFAAIAVASAAATARFVAGVVPAEVRLALFVAFALASSASMWASAAPGGAAAAAAERRSFTAAAAARAAAVGAFTALIGAGGGFVVVPALALSGVPVDEAVSSALLVVCLNAAAGFATYWAGGDVAVHWDVVAPVACAVAAGAALGARASAAVDARLTKRLFAVLVLVVGVLVVAKELPGVS
jgi:hypothetical protein